MEQRPHIVNINDVKPREQTRGKFAFKAKRIWPEAGGKNLACSWFEVLPGKQAFPHHFHSVFEESIYILEGTGTARMGNEKYPIGPGDYISYPPGPETAHSIENTGTVPLRYLAMSTVHTADIVVYPDSKKIAYAAGVDPAKGFLGSKPWVMGVIKEQPSVDYFEGEDTGE